MLKLQDVATVESDVQSRITSFHSCSFANVLRTLKSVSLRAVTGRNSPCDAKDPPPSQD